MKPKCNSKLIVVNLRMLSMSFEKICQMTESTKFEKKWNHWESYFSDKSVCALLNSKIQCFDSIDLEKASFLNIVFPIIVSALE